jgi:hypothetical protein
MMQGTCLPREGYWVKRPYNRSAGDVDERPWLNDREGEAGRGSSRTKKSMKERYLLENC